MLEDQEPARHRRRQGDPQGHRPDGAGRRGARHHGAERLRQEHARPACSPAATATRSPAARCCSTARTCSTWPPRSGPARACSWPSSTRSRSPASTTPTSSRRRSTPCASTAASPSSTRSSSCTLVREKMKLMQMDESLLNRAGQRGLLGRREEAQRDLPDGGARAAARASSTRPTPGLDIDALRIVADGVNALRSPERAFVVITHYQRLLNYIVPDSCTCWSDGRIVSRAARSWRSSWRRRATAGSRWRRSRRRSRWEPEGHAGDRDPGASRGGRRPLPRRVRALPPRAPRASPRWLQALRRRGHRALRASSASPPSGRRSGASPTWRRSSQGDLPLAAGRCPTRWPRG